MTSRLLVLLTVTYFLHDIGMLTISAMLMTYRFLIVTVAYFLHDIDMLMTYRFLVVSVTYFLHDIDMLMTSAMLLLLNIHDEYVLFVCRRHQAT